MTSATSPAPPRLELGRIISLSFGLVRDRWRILGLIVLAYWGLQLANRFGDPVHYKQGSHDARTFALYAAISVSLSCVSWLRGNALVATALQPRHASPSLTRALVAAVGSFLVLLPYRLVADVPDSALNFWELWSLNGPPLTIAYFYLGTAPVLLSYGLLVDAFWGLALPVALAERLGPLELLARSSQLLSGNRWRFVALSLVLTMAATIPSIVSPLLTFPIVRLLHQGGNLMIYFRIQGIVTGLLSSILGAFWLVVTAVAYQELRRVREGVSVGDVAEVFA